MAVLAITRILEITPPLCPAPPSSHPESATVAVVFSPSSPPPGRRFYSTSGVGTRNYINF